MTKRLNFSTIIVKYKYIYIYIYVKGKFGKGQLVTKKKIPDQQRNREWPLWGAFLSELKWIFINELLTGSRQA